MEALFKGDPTIQIPYEKAISTLAPSLKAYDIHRVSKDFVAARVITELHKVNKPRSHFKRSNAKTTRSDTPCPSSNKPRISDVARKLAAKQLKIQDQINFTLLLIKAQIRVLLFTILYSGLKALKAWKGNTHPREVDDEVEVSDEALLDPGHGGSGRFMEKAAAVLGMDEGLGVDGGGPTPRPLVDPPKTDRQRTTATTPLYLAPPPPLPRLPASASLSIPVPRRRNRTVAAPPRYRSLEIDWKETERGSANLISHKKLLFWLCPNKPPSFQ
ncbi:hypothetical protein GW17_00002062 [Ensete ventricosum]|nr:hypothetical protein GW17_00002062 [Ensete ventricosum]